MIVAIFSLPSDDDVLESATKLGLIFFFINNGLKDLSNTCWRKYICFVLHVKYKTAPSHVHLVVHKLRASTAASLNFPIQNNKKYTFCYFNNSSF
jgi:hypothetical protein